MKHTIRFFNGGNIIRCNIVQWPNRALNNVHPVLIFCRAKRRRKVKMEWSEAQRKGGQQRPNTHRAKTSAGGVLRARGGGSLPRAEKTQPRAAQAHPYRCLYEPLIAVRCAHSQRQESGGRRNPVDYGNCGGKFQACITQKSGLKV
jgi:hypothetical protein